MRALWLLMLVGLAGLGAALTLPGNLGLGVLAACGLLVAGVVVLRAVRRRPPPGPQPRWILVDGSNVLHWRDNAPRIETVQEVLQRLSALGFAPVVVFDANVGYLIAGRYLRATELAWVLGLPRAQVRVTPKGIPADPILLGAARELGARIVTCDRYRDWTGLHPEVQGPGLLVRGGIDRERLWLELDPVPAA